MIEWIIDNWVLILLIISVVIVIVIVIVLIWVLITKYSAGITFGSLSKCGGVGRPFPNIGNIAMPKERVEFSVFSSKSIVTKSNFILDVWAYIPDQYERILVFAKEIGRDEILGRKHGLTLERGSILSLAVEIPFLEIPDPIETLVWSGVPTNTSFIVTVPPDVDVGQYPGKVIISCGGITIGKIPFIICVGYSEIGHYTEVSNDAFYPNSAFASYASEDREEVMSRIHGMKKVAPDLDVFLDVISLRSGQDWEQKLEQHVPNKDVFYLFWSHFAAKSEWVEREWKLALSKRGLEYIDPVPLEDVRLTPPPSELKKLHFNDAYVTYIQYEKLRKKLGM